MYFPWEPAVLFLGRSRTRENWGLVHCGSLSAASGTAGTQRPRAAGSKSDRYWLKSCRTPIGKLMCAYQLDIIWSKLHSNTTESGICGIVDKQIVGEKYATYPLYYFFSPHWLWCAHDIISTALDEYITHCPCSGQLEKEKWNHSCTKRNKK